MKVELTLEQALAKASPRLKRLMQHSVEVLRKGEPLALRYDAECGYWLGFSGGKDSQALIHIAQLAGVKFKPFFSPTSVDPAEVIRFIRKEYPEVEFTKITHSIYDEFIKRKCLPSMKIRWCCAEFKEKGGTGKVVLVGVRHSESARRANRKEVTIMGHKYDGDIDTFLGWSEEQIEKRKKRIRDKRAKKLRDFQKGKISEEEYKQFDQFTEREENVVTCINGKDRVVVSPILDWDENDVWEFLNDVCGVPHCHLYDEGRRRLGCIMCPMSSINYIKEDIKRYPHVYEKWVKAIMKVRKQAIISTPPHKAHLEHIQTQAVTTQDGTSQQALINRGGQIGSTAEARRKILVSHSLQEWAGAKSIDKITPPPTTQRTVGGKFLDSTNDDCSLISAENYNEQLERQIAENIIDWWISKKSYKEWYAQKFLQLNIDFGEDEKE